MRRVLAMALVATAVAAGFTVSAADEAPKYTIKEVMKAHKKGGILGKVTAGEATKAEKDELVVMYVEMAKNKPPKGDADSWKSLNDALIAASKDVAADKEGGVAALKKASDCGACHSKHK